MTKGVRPLRHLSLFDTRGAFDLIQNHQSCADPCVGVSMIEPGCKGCGVREIRGSEEAMADLKVRRA